MSKPKLYPVHIFAGTSKWKYTAYVLMTENIDYKSFTPYTDAINKALKETPSHIRGVSFESIPQGWIAVMPKNPFGFPIIGEGVFVDG